MEGIEKYKKVLIIGARWPEPNSSAAGTRMMQLIWLFLKQGDKITFASPSSPTKYSEELEKHGVVTTSIFPNTEKSTQLIKEIHPDIVLFDRFMMEEQFGWRVAEACPNAIRIIDTEDLHFLRKARQKAVQENRTLTAEDIYSETAKREVASILRCDFSLLISAFEMQFLQDKLNISAELLLYLPLTVANNLNPKVKESSFENRKDILFVGNFFHPPNEDAVFYLKNTIWSLLQKEAKQKGIKRLHLNIYGAYTSQKIKQLENKKEGFFVHGRAHNLSETFKKHRLLLAPLRFGAGLKGKIIDAMQFGTPVVTTPIGAEGIHGAFPFAGKITSTPKEIVRETIALYLNKEDWSKAQENGYQILQNRFTEDLFPNELHKKIKEIEKRLPEHRNTNFIGAILRYHQFQSTKYMSKWIEEKKKK